MSTPDEPTRPLLKVVRGDPTPAELAALVTAVSARLAAADEATPPRKRRSAWADPARRLRRPLHPGPDAWRRHGLPG